MKKLNLFVILTAISVSQLHSQWTQTSGPLPGETRCLLYHNNKLFAATDIGLYYLEGTEWILDGLKEHHLLCLASKDEYLFAAIWPEGVFRSRDGGINWEKLNLTDVHVTSLVFMGDDLFAGTENSGVYKSTSNGYSWIAVNNGLTNNSINTLEVIGKDIYAGTNAGVFRSEDNGANWSYFGMASQPVIAFTAIGPHYFTGTETAGVFRSSDNGAAWYMVSDDMAQEITELEVIDQSLYVGTLNGIYSTPNPEADVIQWTEMYVGLYTGRIFDLYPYGDSLYVGTDGGVYYSIDKGLSWIRLNNGMNNATIFALTTNNEKMYAGTRSGVYITTDGDNWKRQRSGANAFCLVPLDSSLYCGTWGHIFQSTHFKTEWVSLDTSGRVYSLATRNDTLFAGTERSGVVRIVHNAPGWWTIIYSGQPASIVHSIAINGKDIFAGTEDGVYRSSDNAVNWTQVGLAKTTIKALIFHRGSLFAGTEQDGIFRSTNNGETWTVVNNGITANDMLSFISTDDYLFAGAWDGQIYLMTDNGSSWNSVTDNMTTEIVHAARVFHSLAVWDGHLYTGTRGAGVWKRPISDMITSVKYKKNSSPLSFCLEQNYPNPFNPSTRISYSIPKSDFVILETYDMLGRKVQTLVSEFQEAGKYSVNFNASKLSSGIYFYKLQAGHDFVETKKMLFVR